VKHYILTVRHLEMRNVDCFVIFLLNSIKYIGCVEFHFLPFHQFAFMLLIAESTSRHF